MSVRYQDETSAVHFKTKIYKPSSKKHLTYRLKLCDEKIENVDLIELGNYDMMKYAPIIKCVSFNQRISKFYVYRRHTPGVGGHPYRYNYFGN